MFRTSAQLDALPDAEVATLFQSADSVLITTVFRETAQRILPVMRASNVKNVIALAGDPALGRNSRWAGRDCSRITILATTSFLRSLTTRTYEPGSGGGRLDEVSAAGGVDQCARLLAEPQSREPAVSAVAGAEPGRCSVERGIAPLQSPQTVRIRRGNEWLPADRELRSDRRLVVVLDDQYADQVGDVGEPLCKGDRSERPRLRDRLRRLGSTEPRGARVAEAARRRADGGNRLGSGLCDRRQQRVVSLPTTPARTARCCPCSRHCASTMSRPTHGSSRIRACPRDSVYYRVAMPELQGISQPLVDRRRRRGRTSIRSPVSRSRVLIAGRSRPSCLRVGWRDGRVCRA